MKKRTRFIACLIAVITAFSAMSLSAQATDASGDVAVASQPEVQMRASIPQGAYSLNLNVNGRRVLSGRVFNLGGVTYVPMFGFADWLGVFDTSYNSNTKTARLSGDKLEISATVGKMYIVANERYFYTGREVILHAGEVYVPITPMVKALSSYMRYNSADSTFYVSSGDTRRLARGSQVYREDEVFWLARIISAESRGEPLNGKIAVGNVVLNRVRSSAYPNTIYGVIFDRRYGVQFSPVANGTIYNTPTADSIIAAKICLEGYSLSDEIIYFLNPSVAPSSWIIKSREHVFTVGNHAFYK